MLSSEKGVLQPMKTFVYRWKIERFFEDCKKTRDYYTSPVFPIRYYDKMTKWYLCVFPKGHDEEHKSYISLFLHFEGENVSDRVTVDYQLLIVDGTNTKILANKVYKAKTFKGLRANWGCFGIAKHDFIKNATNEALIDGTLTLECQITFHDPTVTEKLKDYNDMLDNIGKGLEDYETLLESNHFSDVIFNIQDNKMHLHKAILICRNSVFKAMFEEGKNLRKRQKLMDVVEITDVAFEVMKEVFRFIYSGKVENIDQIAKDLLIAADKYAIPELKALCEKKLYQDLTVDNAIECLKVTNECDTIHLKTLVMEFVAAHSKDIVKKPGFIDLDKQVMHQIMQLMTEKD